MGIFMTENKRGPWSASEKQYIAEQCSKMTAKEISLALQRNHTAVSNYIKQNHASSFTETARSAEYDIKNSPIWRDLENQFSKDELNMFLFHWGRIISQFRDDVYPTEEMQVVDTIKLELLMNRCLSQQQKCVDDIRLLENQLLFERGQEQKNIQEIGNLERQIAILRAAQESLNTDYQNMLKKKNDILKEMKATRDARIKHLESNRNNVYALLKQMVENKEMRSRLGLEMEKMRLAANAEYERLSEYHVYADGQADQPFLTPENVLNE
jgi:hypothetical protein